MPCTHFILFLTFPLLTLPLSHTFSLLLLSSLCTSRLPQQKKDMGSGTGGTKGVGGYRPTINWREISIRKRSVGDKQVLACIVVSGVLIITVGIVLTILGFLVIPSEY